MSHLEQLFPGLESTEHRITSEKDPEYNCIAWALGKDDQWMEPDPFYVCSWPEGIPRTYTLGAYVEAFSTDGYTPCESPESEPGHEKIALFTDREGRPTHAARQLPTGKWTSKLGRIEDIEHELRGLEGGAYGSAALFMKRPCEEPC